VEAEPGRGWPLARLVALAEGSPVAEVCGLLVLGGGGEVAPWPVANVSATPARAFELEPRGLLEALRRVEGSGFQVVGVYHSHLAGGADLSGRDLAGALADGVPVLPGIAQVVVALEGGRASRIRAHRWTGRGFEPADVWRRGPDPPQG
jgi:proteasome lid subunit RPN8/RPN11